MWNNEQSNIAGDWLYGKGQMVGTKQNPAV